MLAGSWSHPVNLSYYFAADETAPDLGNIHGSPNSLFQHGQIAFWGLALWLSGRYFRRERTEAAVCLCWCQCSHGARVALEDNTFPSLGLLKCGVSVRPREIARGSREAALG